MTQVHPEYYCAEKDAHHEAPATFSRNAAGDHVLVRGELELGLGASRPRNLIWGWRS
jgi:hypothetical protein